MDTEYEKTDSTSINNSLSEFMGVLSNACKSPGSSFFYRWIELLEAVDEGIKSTRVNNSLGKMW